MAFQMMDGNPAREGVVGPISWDPQPSTAQQSAANTTGPIDATGITWDAQPTSEPAPQSNNPLAIDDNSGIVAKGIAGANAIGAGIGEGVLDTANGAANLLRLPHATLQARQNELQQNNAANPDLRNVGLGTEGLAEFLLGDEALKGLSVSDRLLKASKYAQTIEESPLLNRVFAAGVRALRGGTVGATEAGLKTGNPHDALTAGATAGATAGILPEAGTAAKAIKAPFSLESIQPELQQGIRDAVNSTAEELGVNPSQSASIRDVANDVATAAKSKASGLYKQLDNAVGNTRFQAYQEQLNDALNELRNSISEADPNGHGDLIEKVNNLEAAKEKAYQTVKDAGLDPDALFAKAQGLWKRGSALDDLGNHVEKSTQGMRPELAADAAKTNPETVSTTKLFNRANQMYNDNRLQTALGEKKATQLLQAIDTAHLQALKIATRQKMLKFAGKLALYGGGYEALRHASEQLF